MSFVRINADTIIEMIPKKNTDELPGLSEKKIFIDRRDLLSNKAFQELLILRSSLLKEIDPPIQFYLYEPLNSREYERAKMLCKDPVFFEFIQKKIQEIINQYKYIIKFPKKRLVIDIFKDDVKLQQYLKLRSEFITKKKIFIQFDPETQIPLNKQEEEILLATMSARETSFYHYIQQEIFYFVNDPKKKLHIQETVNQFVASGFLLAELGSLIVKKKILTPINYLYMQDGILLTASRMEKGFREFLAEKIEWYVAHKLKVNQRLKSPGFWQNPHHPLPLFSELELNIKEAYDLGQLFAYFLLIGCNDGFNNIDSSNSGIGDRGLLLVDQGNIGIEGLGGRTPAEKSISIEKGFIEPYSTSKDLLTSTDHLFPFDEMVFPLLTRSLIPDLWNMTARDRPELRAAMREGFKEIVISAERTLQEEKGNLHSLVKFSIRTSFNHIAEKDRKEVERLLPRVFFHLLEDSKRDNDEVAKKSYTCANVLAGRIRSLGEIAQRMTAGETLPTIINDHFQKLMKIYCPTKPKL